MLFCGMKALRRHLLIPIVMLLCGLVLLSSAERRLAYLDFNSDHSVRIENNDKPDGDEIINRLVFFDDSTEPVAPTVRDVCLATVVPGESHARSLIVFRLSESRAPPVALLSHV